MVARVMKAAAFAALRSPVYRRFPADFARPAAGR